MVTFGPLSKPLLKEFNTGSCYAGRTHPKIYLHDNTRKRTSFARDPLTSDYNYNLANLSRRIRYFGNILRRKVHDVVARYD